MYIHILYYTYMDIHNCYMNIHPHTRIGALSRVSFCFLTRSSLLQLGWCSYLARNIPGCNGQAWHCDHPLLLDSQRITGKRQWTNMKQQHSWFSQSVLYPVGRDGHSLSTAMTFSAFYTESYAQTRVSIL